MSKVKNFKVEEKDGKYFLFISDKNSVVDRKYTISETEYLQYKKIKDKNL